MERTEMRNNSNRLRMKCSGVEIAGENACATMAFGLARHGGLAVLLACVAMAPAQVNSDPSAEIRAVRLRSNGALAAHDSQGFAESLAPDFVMVRGNGVMIPTRQAYIEQMTGDFKNPTAVGYERITDQIEISAAAPLAAEHGHWIGRRPNGAPAYRGTYLAMWRRTETGWKIRSELYVVLSCDDAAACAEYRK